MNLEELDDPNDFEALEDIKGATAQVFAGGVDTVLLHFSELWKFTYTRTEQNHSDNILPGHAQVS